MAISFSAGAKAEICRNIPQKHCCALAECFGILLFCNSFSADGIKIITGSKELDTEVVAAAKAAGFAVTVMADNEEHRTQEMRELADFYIEKSFDEFKNKFNLWKKT